ncbi:hypothetical protein DY000_02007064 [Brassica cretica]|uniref:Uncharacterized protein n=1 Tax=Brassica cretica TaxID=69181 RepID=A0ABQ7BT91_BRACR|nr:hypothetical protein DY000_02007064 [Brassica cretica]
MRSSTRSNKETQLLFSSDPASLERSIRKGICSSSINKNTCSSLDSRQPPSIQTPVSLTDTLSPPSTEDALLPSTEIFHSTSIDTSVQTLIDTEPQDMVATLILVHDEKGDLHDQEGPLRNAAGQRIDAQGAAIPESDTDMIHHGFDPFLPMLTIRGRYEEDNIDRCTSSDVDRYKREASTIEDYDRSMYILYHRSMSRRESTTWFQPTLNPRLHQITRLPLTSF